MLSDINLEIKAGEFLILLGPSGCGKSTLLNCVAGLESIEKEGEIFINNQNVTQKAPKDRNIAMVFQSYALYPTMTVRKNITFGLFCRGVPQAKIEQILKKTVETLQISDLLDRKPAVLSGGQRQRVAIARATIMQPGVILADEPTGNLDSKSGQEVIQTLEALNETGITLIIITHDPAIGDRASRRIHMLDGAIERDA